MYCIFSGPHGSPEKWNIFWSFLIMELFHPWARRLWAYPSSSAQLWYTSFLFLPHRDLLSEWICLAKSPKLGVGGGSKPLSWEGSSKSCQLKSKSGFFTLLGSAVSQELEMENRGGLARSSTMIVCAGFIRANQWRMVLVMAGLVNQQTSQQPSQSHRQLCQ